MAFNGITQKYHSGDLVDYPSRSAENDVTAQQVQHHLASRGLQQLGPIDTSTGNNRLHDLNRTRLQLLLAHRQYEEESFQQQRNEHHQRLLMLNDSIQQDARNIQDKIANNVLLGSNPASHNMSGISDSVSTNSNFSPPSIDISKLLPYTLNSLSSNYPPSSPPSSLGASLRCNDVSSNMLCHGAATAGPLKTGSRIKKKKTVARKKKKVEKDRPLRPLSAYNFFFKDERRKILANFSRRQKDGTADANSGIGFENLAKTIGRRWKQIVPERLAHYKALAKIDQGRYADEKSAVERKGQLQKLQQSKREEESVEGKQSVDEGPGAKDSNACALVSVPAKEMKTETVSKAVTDSTKAEVESPPRNRKRSLDLSSISDHVPSHAHAQSPTRKKPKVPRHVYTVDPPNAQIQDVSVLSEKIRSIPLPIQTDPSAINSTLLSTLLANSGSQSASIDADAIINQRMAAARLSNRLSDNLDEPNNIDTLIENLNRKYTTTTTQNNIMSSAQHQNLPLPLSTHQNMRNERQQRIMLGMLTQQNPENWSNRYDQAGNNNIQYAPSNNSSSPEPNNLELLMLLATMKQNCQSGLR